MARLALRVGVILVALTTIVRADFIQSEKIGRVVYLLNNAPARVERYDLAARQWLSAVNLPATRGVPTAGALDSGGMYVAYGRAIYRYNLDGAGEVQLMNAASDVSSIVTNSTHIFVYHPGSTDMTSIAKATNTIVESKDFWNGLTGPVMSTDGTAIFGKDYDRLARLPVGTDGKLGTVFTNYSGTSSYNGPKLWVSPDGKRIVDSAGAVFSTESLNSTLSFGGAINDIAYVGTDVPIVLRGQEIISYTNGILPAGSVSLGYTPKYIAVDGTDVIAFTPDNAQANGIRANSIPLANLKAPTPGQPVNPDGLPFTPDDAFVDNNGLLYLFSKAHQSLFRWDPVQQKYLATIPLLGSPDFVAYAPDTHAVYTAYRSGLIRKMNLSAATLNEAAFVTTPSSPRGLAAVGKYVFATDDSGAWDSHYVYSPTGTLVESKEWNYYSREYIWSRQNQKMYFFRDDTSPNDLLSEEINESGTAYANEPPGGLGAVVDSPLHDSNGWLHPIRVSPDGSIVILGSGVMHAANTLARLSTALANSVDDIVWLSNDVRTIRTVAGVTQFQQWTGPTYAQGLIKQVPGTAHRLFAISGNRLLAVTMVADRPSFYILDSSFSVIAPSALASPANLAGAVAGSNRVTLSWADIAGEAGYSVERRVLPSGSWAEIGTTGTSVVEWADTTVASGSSYAYRVIAKNGALASEPSYEITVALTAPLKPENVVATKTAPQKITLTWSDVSNESGYEIDRKAGSTGTWSQVGTTSAGVTTSIFDSLTPGTEYFFRVRATNVFGDSPNSAETSATTDYLPPTAPSYLYSSTSSSTSISMYWGFSSYADNYVVERLSSNGTEWVQVATIAKGTTSYTDNNLTPATNYSYRVKATNPIGSSAYSPVLATTTSAPTPPAVPTGLIARPTSGSSVLVTWNNVSGETGFILQRRGDSIDSWTEIATPAQDVTSYTDTGLVTGNQYFYRVAATNAAGTSNFSTADDATPQTLGTWFGDDFENGTGTMWSSVVGGTVEPDGSGLRGSPALVFRGVGSRGATTYPVNTAQGGSVEFYFRAGDTQSPATGWDASESGETVVLEYSINGSTWATLQTINSVYPAYSNWESFNIELPNAARSETTRFRWRQLSNSGQNLDIWALDDVKVRVLLPQAPAAPSVLLASANTSTAVGLIWSEVANAASYRVEMSRNGTWQQIAEVGPGTTSYRVGGLTPDTVYSFRVRSANAGGVSAESPVAMAKTWSEEEDPAKATISFASNSLIIAEKLAGGIGTITVVRSGDTNVAASVLYATSDGSAHSGTDYLNESGLLEFAPGETSKTITLTLLADSSTEPTEYFTVTLSGVSNGAQLGAISSARISIEDDDLPGVVQFAGITSSVKEDAGFAQIKLTRSGGEIGSVSVRITSSSGSATAGQDYSLSTAVVEFAEGESTKWLDLNIVQDDEVERHETVVLTLTPVGETAIGAAGEHTITIIDDEKVPYLNATYAGLLRAGESATLEGLVRFNTTTAGRVTGKIITQLGTRTFTGQVQPDGRVAAFLRGERNPDTGLPQLGIVLDRLGEEFTASYTDPDGNQFAGDGERMISAADAGSISQIVGTFTAVLRGDDALTAQRTLRGGLSIKISSRGQVNLEGFTPDLKGFVNGTGISVSGRIPVGVALQGGAYTFGWLQTVSDHEFEGVFRWTVPSKAGSKTFGAIDATMNIEASRYVPLKLGDSNDDVANKGSYSFELNTTASPQPIGFPVNVAGTGLVTDDDTTSLDLRLTTKRTSGIVTGQLGGSVGSAVRLKGVVLQSANSEFLGIEGSALHPNWLGGWTVSDESGQD